MKERKCGSGLALKQQFINLLAGEIGCCGFDVVLGFESGYNRRICALRFSGEKQLEIFINLNQVRKVTRVKGCSLLFKIRYCSMFVSDYVRQMARARGNMPESYFEGLVFLNAAEVCCAKKKVSVCSPLRYGTGRRKTGEQIRAIEINSAINALNRMRMTYFSEMNETEKCVAETFVNEYLWYTVLPEVEYVKGRVPVYAVSNSFLRLAGRLTEKEGCKGCFPILSGDLFRQTEQMTVKEAFLSCMQSENKFLLGIGLRIFAYLQVPCEFENEAVCDKLKEAAKQYLDDSLMYYNELSASKNSFLKDNLYAIMIAVKEMNHYLGMSGTTVSSGNIHSIQ